MHFNYFNGNGDVLLWFCVRVSWKTALNRLDGTEFVICPTFQNQTHIDSPHPALLCHEYHLFHSFAFDFHMPVVAIRTRPSVKWKAKTCKLHMQNAIIISLNFWRNKFWIENNRKMLVEFTWMFQSSCLINMHNCHEYCCCRYGFWHFACMCLRCVRFNLERFVGGKWRKWKPVDPGRWFFACYAVTDSHIQVFLWIQPHFKPI